MIDVGELDAADALLREVEHAALPEIGSVHPAMLRLALAKAILLNERDDSEAARRLLRQLSLDASAVLPEGHDIRIAIDSSLAQLQTNVGDTVASDQKLYIAIAQGAERLGEGHRSFNLTRLQLAMNILDSGDTASASTMIESVIRTSGGLNEDVLLHTAIDAALARQALSEGRHADALPLARRSHDALATRLGVEAPAVLRIRTLVAGALLATGEAAAGEAEFAAVGAALGRARPGSSDARTIRVQLAQIQSATGRCAEAEPVLRGEIDRRMAADDLTGWIPSLLEDAARCRALAGDDVGAERDLTQAFEFAQTNLPSAYDPMHMRIAGALTEFRLALADKRATAIDPARMVNTALSQNYQAETIDAQAEIDRSTAALARWRSIFLDAQWEAFTADSENQAGLDAFGAIQNATSTTANLALLAGVTRRLASTRDPAVAALLDERDATIARYSAVRQSAYAAGAGAQSSDDILTELDRLRGEVDALDTRVEAVLPDYFSLINPQAVSVEDTQALLAADEAVLLIQPTEYGTHIMLISDDGGNWQRRDALPASALAAHVRRLMFDLGATTDVSAAEAADWQEAAGGGYPFDRTTAHLLYRELIEPFEDKLAGKRHIFVVAAGAIATLPLGVLVAEEPQGRDGDASALRSTAWLAERHVMVSVPSVQALQLLRRSQSGRDGTNDTRTSFAGFGDPLLDGVATTRGGRRGGSPVAMTSLASVADLRALARLPGTAVELDRLRVAMGAPVEAVHTGTAATEAAFRAADLSSVRVLALATHGLLAGEISGATESGLVFTPPSRASQIDDGLLTMSEIATLRLDADWVILSACNTAAGDASNDALSGLARAFFLAGADTLLASQWPVRDDVATRLTVRTIEIQRDTPGVSRAEAFQRAMREIRNDIGHDSAIDTWAHPNAWAPFTLIGDGAR